MRPTKCPDIPVSLERNTEVFRQHFLGAPSTLLIWTGGSTPLLCLEGVPDLPVAPQDDWREYSFIYSTTNYWVLHLYILLDLEAYTAP